MDFGRVKGFIGGLIFILGVIDLIAGIKSDDHIAERIIKIASGLFCIVEAIILWCM